MLSCDRLAATITEPVRTIKTLAPLILVILLSGMGIIWRAYRVNRVTAGAALQDATPSLEDRLPYAVHASGPWADLYFTIPEFRGQRQGGLDAPIVADVDAAQRSVDLAVFALDLPAVTDALLRAHQRGVAVRIVSDTEGLDVSREAAAAMKQLEAAGVPVVMDQRDALMHNKFAVIDDRLLWTGSANLTKSDIYLNNNNMLRIAAPELAAQYARRFDVLAAGGFGREATAFGGPEPAVVLPGDVRVAAYFSPGGGAADAVTAALTGARKSIRVMGYLLTLEDQADALIAAERAGLPVQVILDARNMDNSQSEAARLQDAGVEVLPDGNCFAFHHKVYVIDDRIVVTGSANFTATADRFNDENTLIIEDPALAAHYIAEFDRVLAEARRPDKCPG
jgi:phosphatidylserine/phosphatidylglycerophosphate/cardiolipin synthase-like enzyme